MNDIDSLPFADIEPSKLKVKLQAGDLLLPLRGTRTEAMMFNGVSDNVTTTNQVAIIRPRQGGGVKLEYLHWFFNSAKGNVLLESIRTSASIPNISVKNLIEISVPVPSLEKQERIIDIYHNWCAQRITLRELIANGESMVASAAHEMLDGD
ncbi:restriction endonuclease subunit S [Pseudomonas eucalypticola]|uniref:restriction endonuclease subunit S n=1 Tax=Pseudomonas eucalypticola TaxID=2599595 RepID=UPI001AD92ADC|nr:restriction endonuclease subunit S [Pseudomonas eucalypticola]